ncbi:GTPase-associated system all-helical protein GASH [Runella zeae]|uniref:GTPase-associated system all-helical protein GASH n=1 Tax=Runella zeae TaxID=94255 RepID=UPI002355772D|nr:GTPase-associated system all-helical protein GASH [Runella zeae]
MENKLLQPILQAGLLDIGDSDERLANIESAIVDLEAKLKKTPSLLEHYVLTALDPDISTEETAIIDVEAIIAIHWKALRAKFPERPVQIIRAVIINALYNIGVANVNLARIIYLAASNFYPYAKLGREKTIIKQLIREFGDLAESDAVKQWSLDETEPILKVPTLKITGLQFGEITINEQSLRTQLTTAAKHAPHPNGPNYGTYNQYQQPDQWAAHFAKYAGDGIVDVIKTSLEAMTKSISPTSIETPINKFATDFKKALEQVLGNSLRSLTAVERRSKLLWWKETLYSASLKNSYRTLETELQPVILSVDLFDQLPEVAPVSVNFLLQDTLLLLNNQSRKQLGFAELLSKLLTSGNKAVLKNYLKEINLEGRVGLLNFLTLAVHDKVSIDDLKLRTGISPDAPISNGEFAVAILNGLYVHYLSGL